MMFCLFSCSVFVFVCVVVWVLQLQCYTPSRGKIVLRNLMKWLKCLQNYFPRKMLHINKVVLGLAGSRAMFN